MNKVAALSEFGIINRFFTDIGISDPLASSLVSLGVGDDCALMSVPSANRLAISIDTLVADRHFPANANPYNIAQRALAVSISDLAAMGAKPVAFTLALTLPAVDESWLQQFSLGLRASAEQYQIALIGGDTTRGPLSITIQVHGLVPNDVSLQRNGAQLGDTIYVSGYLGDAGAALDILQNKRQVDPEQKHYFYSRFYQPQARVELAQALLGVASAAIDISDGLLADLAHICKASSVAARVSAEKIPLSNELNNEMASDQARAYALTAGDDYELCFTASAEQATALATLATSFNVPITAIGEIIAGEGVVCVDQYNNVLEFDRTGYQHF